MLRALVTGLLLSVATYIFVALAIGIAVAWPTLRWNTPLDQPAPSYDWAWKAAETMDPGSARAWGDGTYQRSLAVYGAWSAAGYALLAGGLWMGWVLWQSRRHFVRPALDTRGLVLLSTRSLLAVAVLTVIGATAAALVLDWAHRQSTIAQAWHLRAWRAKLPAADRLLVDRYPGGGYLGHARVLFGPEASNSPHLSPKKGTEIQFGWTIGGTNGVGIGHFSPPLQPRQRRLLVESGWIDDATRAALRAQLELDDQARPSGQPAPID
ncbi:MAG: hypothetical protein IT580_06055 [Verrucomicrobiales bacterium]|nr:hypothetical protein [Verrucomicrobiales bacterium]